MEILKTYDDWFREQKPNIKFRTWCPFCLSELAIRSSEFEEDQVLSVVDGKFDYHVRVQYKCPVCHKKVYQLLNNMIVMKED